MECIEARGLGKAYGARAADQPELRALARIDTRMLLVFEAHSRR